MGVADVEDAAGAADVVGAYGAQGVVDVGAAVVGEANKAGIALVPPDSIPGIAHPNKVATAWELRRTVGAREACGDAAVVAEVEAAGSGDAVVAGREVPHSA